MTGKGSLRDGEAPCRGRGAPSTAPRDHPAHPDRRPGPRRNKSAPDPTGHTCGRVPGWSGARAASTERTAQPGRVVAGGGIAAPWHGRARCSILGQGLPPSPPCRANTAGRRLADCATRERPPDSWYDGSALHPAVTSCGWSDAMPQGRGGTSAFVPDPTATHGEERQAAVRRSPAAAAGRTGRSAGDPTRKGGNNRVGRAARPGAITGGTHGSARYSGVD